MKKRELKKFREKLSALIDPEECLLLLERKGDNYYKMVVAHSLSFNKDHGLKYFNPVVFGRETFGHTKIIACKKIKSLKMITLGEAAEYILELEEKIRNLESHLRKSSVFLLSGIKNK